MFVVCVRDRKVHWGPGAEVTQTGMHDKDRTMLGT